MPAPLLSSRSRPSKGTLGGCSGSSGNGTRPPTATTTSLWSSGFRTTTQQQIWPDLQDAAREANDEYFVKHSCPLLLGDAPALETKPYDSFLLKTYRRNVLNNDQWPGEPTSGWTTPDNWYGLIPDLVRSMFVVKYLDGVAFLSDRIKGFCREKGCALEESLEARVEGYYAAHLQLAVEAEVPRRDWSTFLLGCRIEVQITTQLQEMMRSHLHKYYEANCEREAVDPVVWQWDYRSGEFAVNYLGHVLHYLEGKIMEIRDRQEGKAS